MITAAELMKYLNKEAAAWVTAHRYGLNDYVTQSGTVYQCIVAHTSGTFATDLTTNLYWTSSHFIQVSADYAIKRVNEFCNRDFRTTNYTNEFEGDSSNMKYVNNAPVTAISAIEYLDESTGEYVTIFSGSDDASNSVKFFDPGKIMLLKGYTFSSGVTYKISYTGGYSTNAMPEDVKGSCKEIAAIHLKKSNAGQGYLGLTSRNMAGQGTEAAGFNFEQEIQNSLKAVESYKFYNV